MERTMSTDEKIRRAEEIYQRRKLNEGRTTSARVNVADSPKNYNLFKKMILQIMICLVIYFIFFLVKNSNYIFSQDFLKNAREILSYDINLQEQYNSAVTFIQNSFMEENKTVENETQENEEVVTPPAEETEEAIGEGVTETTQENNEEGNQDEGAIGGAEFPDESIAESIEDSSSVSQTLTDANAILENYSLIKPLSGTITSRFGLRNPTTETVPKYHTGIDIAANTGTKFIASMEGDVVLVSSEGDYRKPY